MRVKRFDLQEPVIVPAIAVEKVDAVLKRLAHREVLFTMQALAVVHVLPAAMAAHFTQRAGCSFRAELVGCKLGGGGGQIGHPVITFLAAIAAPAGITAVVGAAAILDIMVMVGSKAAVDAVLFQDFRHGIIIRFHGAPAAVQEVIAAGVQLSAGRHAGQTAHITFVKADGMGCQTLKVGGRDGAAIHAQQIPAQGVIHDHQCFHGWFSLSITDHWRKL